MIVNCCYSLRTGFGEASGPALSLRVGSLLVFLGLLLGLGFYLFFIYYYITS